MHLQPFSPYKTGWQRGFGSFFLLWLFFDLCVVHLLCPQYAASELFGCAVPAVVTVSSLSAAAQGGDGTPELTAVATSRDLAEKGALVHSCLWNTQSVVESLPFVVPPPHFLLLASSCPRGYVSTLYAHLFPGAIFHPPRQS